MKQRRHAPVGLVLAVALFFSWSAAGQAANIVPNPGFETDCAGVPCNWSPESANAVIARDTTTALGMASLRVTAVANAGGAMSTCLPLSPGTYNAAFSYNVAATPGVVDTASFRAGFYGSTDCSGALLGLGVLNATPPLRDGAWHQVAGTETAPSGTQSVRFFVFVFCGSAVCNPPATANFDNLIFQTEPLAVTMASIAAARRQHGVLVRWHTAAEVQTAGFNLYRGGVKINRRLISARGRSTSGASYRFLDRTARDDRSYRYRVQVVNLDGSREWAGSALLR